MLSSCSHVHAGTVVHAGTSSVQSSPAIKLGIAKMDASRRPRLATAAIPRHSNVTDDPTTISEPRPLPATPTRSRGHHPATATSTREVRAPSHGCQVPSPDASIADASIAPGRRFTAWWNGSCQGYRAQAVVGWMRRAARPAGKAG